MEFEKIEINKYYILCRTWESNFQVGDTVKVLAKIASYDNYNVLIENNNSVTWVNNNWLEHPLKVKTAIDFYPGDIVRVSWAHMRYPGALAVIDYVSKNWNIVTCILPDENNTKLLLHPCEILDNPTLNDADRQCINNWKMRHKVGKSNIDPLDHYGDSFKMEGCGMMDYLRNETNSIYVKTSKEYGIKSIQIFEEKKIVTVVFTNGKVEVIKCAEGDNFDPYIGVALAIAQHLYGSKNRFHKFVNARAKKK